MSETNATPLVELLRSVPINHRTEWEIQWADDGTPTGHALCPVGSHCHMKIEGKSSSILTANKEAL